MATEFNQVVDTKNPKNECTDTIIQQPETTDEFGKDDISLNKESIINENSEEVLKSGLLGVNLQPEKIVDVFTLPDGSHSFCVEWKSSWIHEQLIKSYQPLVDEFWVRKNEDNLDIAAQKKKDESADIVTPLFQLSEGSGNEAGVDAPKDFSITPSLENNNEVSRKRKASNEVIKKRSKKGRGRPRKSVVQVKITRKDNTPEQESEINETECDEQADKPKKEKREKYLYGDEKGPCPCNICGKIISNKYGLREHQSVVHFKNGRFQCEVCGKRVTNKRALNLHMTAHSNTRSFVCDKCGSSHKTKGNLNYHIKTMHSLIKNFRCDICFKTFKVQADLKEHCFTVHANAGVITCIVCKKKLTTALSIYTHSVMHSGAREFECEICGYAFKTFTGLKEHKVTHSEDKPVRTCPYCEKRFYSRSQYNAHVMRHTADGGLVTYKCPICDTKFQHKSSYNRHVIRHQPGGDLEFQKENPYLLLDESELPEGVCQKCRKHYSSKSGFYLHVKKCRDGIVQQYECPFCDNGCANRSSLKRHIQRRHKGMEFEIQTIQGREIIQKDDHIPLNPSSTVISSQDDIQYQSSYFDHGYGNQVTTVDAQHLTAVDVQLLIDNSNNQHDVTVLSNVDQLQQSADSQNLHILTENEAAQFTAQLAQQGVIVRSSDVHVNGDQLIVSTSRMDPQISQLLVSENQAAQLIANAQALQQPHASHLQNQQTLSLQGEDGVLHIITQHNLEDNSDLQTQSIEEINEEGMDQLDASSTLMQPEQIDDPSNIIDDEQRNDSIDRDEGKSDERRFIEQKDFEVKGYLKETSKENMGELTGESRLYDGNEDGASQYLEQQMGERQSFMEENIDSV